MNKKRRLFCLILRVGETQSSCAEDDEPYELCDAVDGHTIMAVYGVYPYCTPYHTINFFGPNGVGTVAVIRMLSSRKYGNGVQPYTCGEQQLCKMNQLKDQTLN